MKIEATTAQWDNNAESNVNQISVDSQGMGKMIALISKNIYSHAGSSFREYWLNARESHQAARAAGCSPRPMEITLPLSGSSDSPVGQDTVESVINNATLIENTMDNNGGMFTIRDYGVGLNRSDLRDMISRAGASTKDNSNEYGGGMGIGTLSGFYVSDQVMFTAYQDGKENTIILSAENSSWSILDEKATTEPNGMRVSLAVKQDKIHAFSTGALAYLTYSGFCDEATIMFDPNSSGYITTSSIQAVVESSAPQGDTVTTDSGMSVSAVAASSNDWHSREVKNNRENISVRIDGCFYEGVVPDLSSSLTSAVFSTIRDTWGDDVMKHVNTSAVKALTSRDNNRSYLYGSNPDSILTNGINTSSIIVDVPVGRFTNSIQPSRESVVLTAEDSQEILEAVASLCKSELEIMRPMVTAYATMLSEGSTPENYARYAEERSALTENHSHLLTISSMLMYPYKVEDDAECVSKNISISYHDTGTKCVEDGVIRGNYENVGFLTAPLSNGKVALFSARAIKKENNNGYSYLDSSAAITWDYLGEHDRGDLMVVNTKRQKDDSFEVLNLLRRAKESKTLTNDVVIDNGDHPAASTVAFKDKMVLVNTPYISKIVGSSPAASAVFTDPADDDLIETVDYAEFKKNTGADKVKTQRSTVSIAVSYPVEVYKRSNRSSVNKWGEDKHNELSMEELSDIIDECESPLIIVDDGASAYCSRYIIGYVNDAAALFDNQEFIVISLTGAKREKTLRSRLEKIGVSEDNIFTTKAISQHIGSAVLENLRDEDKEKISALCAFTNSRAHTLASGIEDTDDQAKVYDAVGLGDVFALVSPFTKVEHYRHGVRSSINMSTSSSEWFSPKHGFTDKYARIAATALFHVEDAPLSSVRAPMIRDIFNDTEQHHKCDNVVRTVFSVVYQYGSYNKMSAENRGVLFSTIMKSF